MKNLIFKEFKLAVHPIIYVFVFVFPLMGLIPNYPLFISTIYTCSMYPILFLGSNKGQQSNDLIYSTLLPVRKKDLVLARIITIAIMQVVGITLTSLFGAFGHYVLHIAEEAEQFCLTGESAISFVGFSLLSFCVMDAIFLPCFYKNGKGVLLGTLLGILFFCIVASVFNFAIPFIPVVGEFVQGTGVNIWKQIVILIGSIGLYILFHYLIYKISAKRLENVDF